MVFNPDYPCATFPVTFANPGKDPNKRTGQNLLRTMYINFISLITLDDPEKYEGGPVGLQIIGRRFEEGNFLDILEIVAETIGTAE